MWKFVLAATLLLSSSDSRLLAHSGGTDANGCHTNRKTGDFHCHGSRSAPVAPSSREASPSPPAEAPVVRKATAEEISASQGVPSSFLPRSRPEPPLEKIEFVDSRKGAADGFEVIRPNVRQLVQVTQRLLRAQKYEIADKSGELGYSTIVAIRAFQSRNKSIPDGRVTPELLFKLAETLQVTCKP
jgi:hypothetical protein